MINTTEFEKVFLLFALDNPVYLEPTQKGFFTVSEIDLLAQLSKRYFKKFKKSPTPDNLWLLITTGSLEERCSKQFFDEVFKRKVEYDVDWVKQTAESWIKWKHLDLSIVDTVEYLNTTKVTPENVNSIVQTVRNLINNRNNITFDDDLGADFFNASVHKRKSEDLVSTNYEFMDKGIGGYAKGTINVYVAPPNTGKSLFMCNDAVEYVKLGKNVLYVSLEMGAQKVAKRIGANLLNIPIGEYDTKTQDLEWTQNKLKQFRETSIIEPGQLTIKNYPTSSATVDDLDNFIGKVQDVSGIIYDVVIIDYINILRDLRNPNTESTYLKIKNICEDLRALSQRRNFVMISATQGNRNSMNNSDITMNDIAESAGLAATADNIMAIIQTAEMNISNMYWLKLLKIRDGSGKHTRCRINVDYEYMRLQETSEIITDTE